MKMYCIKWILLTSGVTFGGILLSHAMPDHSLPKEDMLSPLSSRSCLLALGIQSHTQPRAIQHSWSVVSVRLKGSKTSKKGSKQVVNEEEEGGEDDDPEKSVNIDETKDDPSVPQDYKDLEKAVQSFRYDLDLDMVRK